MKSPVSIYVVHHPQCEAAAQLAWSLFDWFRLGYLSGDQSGAGLPVYYRRKLTGTALQPEIRFEDAELNVVIILVDEKIVVDTDWREAIVKLARDVGAMRDRPGTETRAILLPAAMHDSFYRTGPLYQGFNPIRLLGMAPEQMKAALRRAATEATARMVRGEGTTNPPPLDVFLSHSKRDGRQIAERIRDGVRSFGQLVAWYDANDLPYGAAWESPMVNAARNDTAAMVVTVTDAYPTRPWCRKEASLARTPVQLTSRRRSRVWKVQPVVAVHKPGPGWVRGIPMLDGVPRIGWDEVMADDTTERIVDRLVLEVLLGLVHRKIALELERNDRARSSACFVTWVPDSWTLSKLRQKLGPQASSIRRIVYPGYGLAAAEIGELQPVIESFHKDTKLVSFEEALD